MVMAGCCMLNAGMDHDVLRLEREGDVIEIPCSKRWAQLLF